jgi:hypothetical protein
MGDSRYEFPRPGLGKTGQYQMAGIPFLTSSIKVDTEPSPYIEIPFPRITKFVTVTNTYSGSNRPIRVGFSAHGTNGNLSSGVHHENYFVLNNGESYTGEWRVASVWLSSHPHAGAQAVSSASVLAGLTGIPRDSFPISQSQDGFSAGFNWSGSLGVG